MWKLYNWKIRVDLCGYLWIFVDICGYLWIFVDICGYSIQSYLHAGRPNIIIKPLDGSTYTMECLTTKTCDVVSVYNMCPVYRYTAFVS